MNRTNLIAFITQSNAIEGITRPPTEAEIDAHVEFLKLSTVTVESLEKFVLTVAGASLRDLPGMDVRVGRYYPPKGGSHIVRRLKEILEDIPMRSSYQLHQDYESLHPFMDGNGRSGRVLWLWMQDGRELLPLGFLHRWYYDSLQEGR